MQCCLLLALMVAMLSGCRAAADFTVFSPRGSFLMTPTKTGSAPARTRSGILREKSAEELRGTGGPSARKQAARDDEFHPRRSYSQQLISMMSLSSDPSLNGTDCNVSLRNHSSVQELANTLLADPMSLFRRRRTQWRSASARGRMAITSSLAHATNASSPAVSSGEARANLTAETEDGVVADVSGGIQKLTLSQREALVRKWGAAFEQLEEEAFALFCRLHSAGTPPVGRLTKNEFAGALRLMGADHSKASFDRLLHFMFEAIDLERTGSIGFPEFVEWLLLITSENVQDRLRWGFQICDVRSTGRIARSEVTALIRLMFGVLTGLELDHNNPYVGDLVSSLFESGAAHRATGLVLPAGAVLPPCCHVKTSSPLHLL
jgi:Ca2+-binding EF-hand superfamily protein